MRLLDISLEQHVLESVVQVKATLEGLVDFLGDGRVAVVRGGIGAEEKASSAIIALISSTTSS